MEIVWRCSNDFPCHITSRTRIVAPSLSPGSLVYYVRANMITRKTCSNLSIRAFLRAYLPLGLLLAHMAVTVSYAAGTVVAWGDNTALQRQVPVGLGKVLAVAAGEAHSLALKTNGTVTAWGLYTTGQTNVPPGLSNVVALAAGSTFSLALKTNGTVVQWGALAAAPLNLTNAVAIAAGWTHALALKQDGTVIGWGDNTWGQTTIPTGLSNVTAIAAGDGNSLALLSSGTVVAWGDNSFSKTNVPFGLANVTAIAAGQDHCLALKRDGRLVAWGNNLSGQTTIPANATNVVAIGAGAGHSVVLKQDSTLIAWGDNQYSQTAVPNQSGFIALAVGGYHSLVILGDGSPVILWQPASQSIIIGSPVSFQVAAAGTTPFTFQWRRNGSNLLTATTAVLSVTNVQATDAGSYSVVVANPYGSATSLDAVLIPLPSPPVLNLQPQPQSAFCGDSATFRVSAEGAPPLGYQWFFQGTLLSNATQASLTLSNVVPTQAGGYWVVITNIYGSVTSVVASLDVPVDPSLITSALTASAKQGSAFNYTITARHSPILFGADHLPPGLSFNPATALISGTNLENGTFGVTISAANACATDTKTLVLTITTSIPVITSALTATGTEGTNLTYRIRASNTPTSYGAQALPLGLTVDPLTGTISGIPVYPGSFSSTISASNAWGVGSATLRFTISSAPVTGLAISDVVSNYASPYLVEFQFTLRSDTNPAVATPITAAANFLSFTCTENDVPLSDETAAFHDTLIHSSVSKTYLVLDFTESIASLANGDANGDGISDAVDNVVTGAQIFVTQQPVDAQIGVYEFHRDDLDPQKVIGLSTVKDQVNQAIGGIWTNYVMNFPAGSRCWDALYTAVTNLGPAKSGEQHSVVFVSDGVDESSVNTVATVLRAATNNSVRIYCIGFGAQLDPTALQSITVATGGSYYTAPNAAALSAQFAQISKQIQAVYFLRWATLKRSSTPFQPGFSVSYQGFTAVLVTNFITPAVTNVDQTQTPPVTNITAAITNILIPSYIPTQHTGTVSRGTFGLVANAEDAPKSVSLYAGYVPRYIRQLSVHYRPNWPCIASLQSTNVGELLYGWSLSQTNDGLGGLWLTATSPNPLNLSSSIPFCGMGSLIKFSLRDMLYSSNAFSVFTNDNTIYTNTGGQSFLLAATNVNPFITFYTNLPYGTPVPWLIAHGFASPYDAAELSDPDHDGVPTWQEYSANTDPQDANSTFLVRSLFQALDGRYQIIFSTALGRTYRVDSSTDLQTWQTLQDKIVGINADVTVADTRYLPGATTVFYRVLAY